MIEQEVPARKCLQNTLQEMKFENETEQDLNPASAIDRSVSLNELFTHFGFLLCKMKIAYFTRL